MLMCLIPSIHFADGTVLPIALSGCFTIAVGTLLSVSFRGWRSISDKRTAFVIVVAIWVALSLFATLPLMATGSVLSFTDAFFEAMSGVTSAGASILPTVENLPSSTLLWRSMMQWFGGFGIILLVLAAAPSLGINKYTLYTAEASGADNTGKVTASVSDTVRQTLLVYVLLTVAFIMAYLATGMQLWDAVNLTFTNISSGGFSIYNDSIASLSHTQQYITALAMFCSGVNFMLLFLFITFRWRKIGDKLDQFGFYFGVCVVAIGFVMLSLHHQMGYGWNDALRLGTVQTLSVITTTGSMVADTSYWWVPVTFLFVILSLCGGMAGSTTGGLKVMRVLILVRNVRTTLRNRLHPHAVNPVRLNGKPVSQQIITNVMVVFFVYVFTILLGVLALVLSGINATEAIGAVVSCITGYGPGLGLSGGFGNYAAFTPLAKWICAIIMLMGRLECISVYILFVPMFWKR